MAAYQDKGLKPLASEYHWLHRIMRLCLWPVLLWVGWLLYATIQTELWLAPLTTQGFWQRTNWPLPTQTIYRFLLRQATLGFNNLAQTLVLIQIALILLSLALLLNAVRKGKLRWELWLYSALAVALPLTSQVVSIGRYALLTMIPFVPLFLPER